MLLPRKFYYPANGSLLVLTSRGPALASFTQHTDLHHAMGCRYNLMRSAPQLGQEDALHISTPPSTLQVGADFSIGHSRTFFHVPLIIIFKSPFSSHPSFLLVILLLIHLRKTIFRQGVMLSRVALNSLCRQE